MKKIMGLFSRAKKKELEKNFSKKTPNKLELENFKTEFKELYYKAKFSKCLKLAKSFYKKYPNHLDVIKNLSDAYMSKKQFWENKKMLESSLEMYPNVAFIRLLLSITYGQLKLDDLCAKILINGLSSKIIFDERCSDVTYLTKIDTAMQKIQQPITPEFIQSFKTHKEIPELEKFLDINLSTIDLDRELLKDLNKKSDSFKTKPIFAVRTRITQQSINRLQKENELICSQIDYLRRNYRGTPKIRNKSKNTLDDPLQVLKLRLAKGEITKEEYEDLTSTIDESLR